MRQLTRKEFRTLTLLGAVLWIMGGLLEWLDIPRLSSGARLMLDEQNYDAIASVRLLTAAYWPTQLAFAAGIIGLALFKEWGRSLLLLTNVVWAIMTFFSGVLVYAPVTSGLLSIASDLLFIALVLSYFPPHNAYFASRAGPEIETTQF